MLCQRSSPRLRLLLVSCSVHVALDVKMATCIASHGQRCPWLMMRSTDIPWINMNNCRVVNTLPGFWASVDSKMDIRCATESIRVGGCEHSTLEQVAAEVA